MIQWDVMKNKRHFEKPIDWLPIDSRLIPLLSFPHVKGVARIFLMIEIILSFCVVMGTLLVTLLTVFL